MGGMTNVPPPPNPHLQTPSALVWPDETTVADSSGAGVSCLVHV